MPPYGPENHSPLVSCCTKGQMRFGVGEKACPELALAVGKQVPVLICARSCLQQDQDQSHVQMRSLFSSCKVTQPCTFVSNQLVSHGEVMWRDTGLHRGFRAWWTRTDHVCKLQRPAVIRKLLPATFLKTILCLGLVYLKEPRA